VTFLALNSFRAQVPSKAVDERLTIFWSILEEIRWSPEVPRMMCIVAALRVVRIFLGWAPTCLVVEHEEDITFLLLVKVIEVLV